MNLTPLHLALGVSNGELSMAMVEAACELGVTEREDLDWKSTLPLTLPAENSVGRSEQQDELAKDIAAMANTRGGLLIYGVTEVRRTSAASEVRSVGEPSDQTLQNIRRVASNLVHPPVTGLTFSWLADEAGNTALGLHILQSTEAPHLVRPRKQPTGTGFWFAVPYRNGPDTEWMPEKMIESAYRDRLANRRQREQDLQQMHADLTAATAREYDGSWVVAVARPENPLPARPRLLDPRRAAAIFARAWNSPWKDYLRSAVAADRVLDGQESRRGLRRFRQSGIHRTTAMGSSQGRIRAVAELHYDGSVGVAISRGGALHPDEFADPRFVVTTDLDQAALNLFELARQASLDLGVGSDYEVLLSVESQLSVLFRHPDTAHPNLLRPFAEEDRVPAFRSVEGTYVLSGDITAALESLVDLAEDAVNQTGSISRLDARHLELELDRSR